MSVCREPECKAEVMWTHTGEAWLAVDVEPVEDGNVLLSGGNPPRSEVLAGERLVKARAAEIRLYKTHRRTCVRGSAGRKAAA